MTQPAAVGARAPSDLSFLAVDGEMARRMRRHDWTHAGLGAPEDWPQSLKTVVRIVLSSRYAMWMAWGPELIFFCNDAYKPTLGVKEAWALGRRSEDVWSEIWGDVGPRIAHVLKTGNATWDEGLLLFLERSGYPEETYHTFSYSPLADDAGVIAGMLCVVTEVSDRVIGERRLSVLRDLAYRLAGTRSQAQVMDALELCLEADSHDLPFVLTYLMEEDETAVLAFATPDARMAGCAPSTIDLGDPSVWPLDRAVGTPSGVLVEGLERKFEAVPCGPWPIPPKHALILPIGQQALQRPLGFLVVGLNPYRLLDETYRGFIGLFVGQLTSGISGARVHEEEQRRAEALAELDRAKTIFFSNVSHEFRTPLALMLGPLEDALAQHTITEQGDPQRERLEIVHRNSLRLLKLVNSLLDFSRIEAGRMTASFQPTQLSAFTAELVSNFRSATDSAGLYLFVDAPPLASAVYVDRDMWEKIILNLVSNAFKFTLSGGIAVSVGESPDGMSVQVAVRDTGVGIPAHEMPRLFERFHRVEGVQGRSIEGSGIGLALVQELVVLHGGSIAVDSTPGHGTTFTVSLPFGSAHLPAAQIESAAAPTPDSRAQAFVVEAMRWISGDERREPPGAIPVPANDVMSGELSAVGLGRRIILADDNSDMRGYVCRLLESRGYQIDAVPDGLAALEVARQAPPDLIVTDVMMPELDGFGLLEALRADEATRDIPVIMLSARAGEEARVEGLRAGADGYLVKPFSARELFAYVDSSIRLAEGRQQTAIAMREESLRTRRLFEQAPGFIAILRGPDHVFEFVNEAYGRLANGRPLLGRSVKEAFPDLAGQGFFEWLDNVYHTGKRFVGQKVPVRLQLEADDAPQDRVLDFIYEPVIDADGVVTGVFVEGYDASDSYRYEQHLRLLIEELNHRVKNTLAIVQGIARQTFHDSSGGVEARAAFEGRLAALAVAHNLLTRQTWESADLRELVSQIVHTHAGRSRNIQIQGPGLSLEPKTAVTLAMALHELATNATKYGALSVEGGMVAITWTVSNDDPPAISIRWTESGGPAVEPPKRRGFGTRMIERALANELQGTAVLDFLPEGLVCRIDATLPRRPRPSLQRNRQHGPA